jgi:hypothetical protein
MDSTKKRLIQAAIDGSITDFDKVSFELPKGTAAQDIKDEAGSNALHLASHHGKTELAEHLVDNYGFDAHSQVDGQGRQNFLEFERFTAKEYHPIHKTHYLITCDTILYRPKRFSCCRRCQSARHRQSSPHSWRQCF